MQIQIDQYRGWSISFDTEKETFYCHSDQWDKDMNKNSFSSVKKWIDDFIKDNEVFKPVWIVAIPTSYFFSKGKVKLIGIRKDGRFIYENDKGEKKQLSEYKEKDFILYDEANEKYTINANEIQRQIESLELQKKEVLKNVTGVSLVEYKKQISEP